MPKRLPKVQEFDIDRFNDFTNIKLVAIDLDGTLLNSSERVLPDKFLKLVRRLKHHICGTVRVTIATGRTLAGVRTLLGDLDILKDTPIILYNGSIILNKKHELLYQKNISLESLKKIHDISSHYRVKVIAYACKWLLQETLDEHAFGWSSLDKPDFEYNNMCVKWCDWNNFDNICNPSAIVIYTAGHVETTKRLSQELEKIDDIAYSRGGFDYIEVRPNDTNKGIALKIAAEKLNLSQEQVLAIGDNENDIEMLEWAGIGVSVGSASKCAYKSSDYNTDSGVFTGAIEVLRLVHEARRLRGKK
jgi:Cof subfamily protein (haloacid dehalogenase superfamily)